MELIGFYFVACALLVGAGVSKVLHPDDTARALATVLPEQVPVPARVTRSIVRLGSFLEAALGVVALVLLSSATAWLVATSYVAFAAVILLLLRARGGPIASCGCFGTPDTPATSLHAAVDLALASAAIAVALATPSGSAVSVLAAQPLHGVPLLASAALCAWLTFLTTSRLAQVEAARRLLGISRQTRSNP